MKIEIKNMDTFNLIKGFLELYRNSNSADAYNEIESILEQMKEEQMKEEQKTDPKTEMIKHLESIFSECTSKNPELLEQIPIFTEIIELAIKYGYDSSVFDPESFGVEANALRGLLKDDKQEFFTNIISAFRNEADSLEKEDTCVNHLEWLIELLAVYNRLY